MRKILSQDQLVFSTIKTYVLNFDTLVDLSQEEVTVQWVHQILDVRWRRATTNHNYVTVVRKFQCVNFPEDLTEASHDTLSVLDPFTGLLCHPGVQFEMLPQLARAQAS